MVYSVQAISLSMVPGIATHGIPFSHKALAPRKEPSPPMTTTPLISNFLHVSTACFCPSSVIKAGLLAVNKAVPPF